jgi:hypothetical protein
MKLYFNGATIIHATIEEQLEAVFCFLCGLSWWVQDCAILQLQG